MGWCRTKVREYVISYEQASSETGFHSAPDHKLNNKHQSADGRFSSVHCHCYPDESKQEIFHEQATGGVVTKQQRLTDTDSVKEDVETNNQPANSINEQRSSNSNALFVDNLHPRIGDLHLTKLFKPYGEIKRIIRRGNQDSVSVFNDRINAKERVCSKSRQQSKGYAIVEYKHAQSAQMAIARIDGRQLLGKTLVVRLFRPKCSSDPRKKEFSAVQSKIDAVKRAIEQKKRRDIL